MNSKAEMGIGTLIIFIALLLVAAVAAGVLIQTTGSLQEKALMTGDQARNQIATNAEVIEVSATDGRKGNVTDFTIIMKLSAGSEPIKLGEVVYTFNTYSKTVTLSYKGNDATNIKNQTTGYWTNDTLGVGNFTVEYLQAGPNFVEGNLQRGDVVKIYFASPEPIYDSEAIRMNFIPKVGTPTLTQFITPEVISTERVYLYP